jgi:hypothetical protein
VSTARERAALEQERLGWQRKLNNAKSLALMDVKREVRQYLCSRVAGRRPAKGSEDDLRMQGELKAASDLLRLLEDLDSKLQLDLSV